MGEGRWKGGRKLAPFQALPKDNDKFLRWAVMGRAEVCVVSLKQGADQAVSWADLPPCKHINLQAPYINRYLQIQDKAYPGIQKKKHLSTGNTSPSTDHQEKKIGNFGESGSP